MDCLFCRIIDGTIPSDVVYQDEYVIAFRDVNPQAPVHVLFVPKVHVSRFSQLKDRDVQTAIFRAVSEYTEREGLEEDGYRLVVNTGAHGQQTVDHLHVHLLAGRQLQWPPG